MTDTKHYEPLPAAEVAEVQAARAELLFQRDLVLANIELGTVPADDGYRAAADLERRLPRWSRTTLGECRPLCTVDHNADLDDGLDDLVYHGRTVLTMKGDHGSTYVRVEFCDELIEGNRSVATISVHGAEQLTSELTEKVIEGLKIAELLAWRWNIGGEW